jgi:hypothetical protein
VESGKSIREIPAEVGGCETSCYVFIQADWRYKDTIDMHSWRVHYNQGSFDLIKNRFNILPGLSGAAEGLGHFIFDELLGCSYPFVVDWKESLGGCCEEFL